jgi:hypothetical protein
MLRTSKTLLALAPLLVLVACQDPDVGNPCTLMWSADWERLGTEPPPTATLLYAQDAATDYFESGNSDCEGLVCIVSPAAPGTKYGSDIPGLGYCSKSCISNDQCYPDETGLECRQMVLDDVYLAELERTNPDAKDRYLGETGFSSYCGVPR